MPLRSSPTARQARLGAELRKLREQAGLSVTEASRRLGVGQTQISNIEASRFGVSADRLRALAHNYSCTDDAFIDALIAIAGERKRGWWEEYRELLPAGLLALAELEHHAARLRIAHTSHIPGLLQTADHAREVFRHAVTPLTPPEVEHRVSFRIKRQVVLYRHDPLPCDAIIHEAALRMKFGGPQVTRAQLEHLLEMGEREHVTILVIPFDAGAYPGSGQSVCYVDGPVPQLDTVQLDQSHGTVLLDDEAQLSKYRNLLTRMESAALDEEQSRDFIRGIAKSLRG
ncbi:helix-turn-helix transcriptional regulator [Streptomyces sp. MST-110588]|uniref:helix-turn-helix domain-containing protein n=1 Tax=Streptomyces sp. MST-110588 TaxID=2833628 RepID=UPI001F5D4E1D|nr:helix-turn-helix transcriptional regulator [Streptomyces sp. MST-110588]UNO40492.1 helix-turn-helix transcriptional regulator [Streptomyces sp. MST-110588]